MGDSDIIATIRPLVALFNTLGIPYYIGGSVASSAFGKARSTLDVDIVARIATSEVGPLVTGLKNVFYISEQAAHAAVRAHGSFNIVHLETMLKVDLFVLKTREYDRQAFNRRQENHLDLEIPDSRYFLAAPEDIILNKLEWYLAGGQVSERQWGDIIGVMKVQSGKLNIEYLEFWAKNLKLETLLSKAFKEVTQNSADSGKCCT